MAGALMLIYACIVIGGALAQDAPAAGTVDRTDPQAVVQAYLEAANRGDAEMAAALLTADGPGPEDIRSWTGELDGLPEEAAAVSMRAWGIETGFLPYKGHMAARVLGTEIAGDGALVRAEFTEPRTAEFVLRRDAEGKWAIDFYATVKRAKGSEYSLLELMGTQAPAEGPPRLPDGTAAPGEWERMRALERVAGAVQKMAEASGRYVAADHWMDEMLAYSMDEAIVDPFPESRDTVGMALNAAVAGQPVTDDWEQRYETPLVFQTAQWERNAAGTVEDALAGLEAEGDTLLVAMAGGLTVAVPRGTSWASLVEGWRRAERCSQNVATVCEALLRYAREHGGFLPPAASWCEDIRIYVPPDELTPALFVCPGAPELEYGYALNAALAGKNIRELRHHGNYVLLLPAEEGTESEVLAVPEEVELGRHFRWWGQQGPQVTVGMLDGSTQDVAEGEPYPGNPAVPGPVTDAQD